MFRRNLIPTGIVIVALIALLFSVHAFPQARSPFPIDVTVGPAPQSFMVDGRARLWYELHFTNFAPFKIELTSIDVLGDTETPLATFRADTLEKMVIPAERVVVWADPPKGAPSAREIAEGHTAVIFFDVALDPAARAPAKLRHRFSFSSRVMAAQPSRALWTAPPFPLSNSRRLCCARHSVEQAGSPLMPFPTAAAPTIAARSTPSTAEFMMRSASQSTGRASAPMGACSPGDSKSNANFYGYGAEVVAVADGRIADLKDNLPDNVGSNDRAKRVITLDNALGNFVTIDLGNGHFAIYGHLQPGSLKVKLGDTVKAGQVLALLGNSGNSDGPHLHFQLTDASSPLASEGIPYEIRNLHSARRVKKFIGAR